MPAGYVGTCRDECFSNIRTSCRDLCFDQGMSLTRLIAIWTSAVIGVIVVSRALVAHTEQLIHSGPRGIAQAYVRAADAHDARGVCALLMPYVAGTLALAADAPSCPEALAHAFAGARTHVASIASVNEAGRMARVALKDSSGQSEDLYLYQTPQGWKVVRVTPSLYVMLGLRAPASAGPPNLAQDQALYEQRQRSLHHHRGRGGPKQPEHGHSHAGR